MTEVEDRNWPRRRVSPLWPRRRTDHNKTASRRLRRLPDDRETFSYITYQSQSDWQHACDLETLKLPTLPTTPARQFSFENDSDKESSPRSSDSSSESAPSRHSSNTSLGSNDHTFDVKVIINGEVPPAYAQYLPLSGDRTLFIKPEAGSDSVSEISVLSGQSSNTIIEASGEVDQRAPPVQAQPAVQPESDFDLSANEYHWKGKGRATLIRDIRWETVDEQNVSLFCASYNTHMQDSMGAVLSSRSHARESVLPLRPTHLTSQALDHGHTSHIDNLQSSLLPAQRSPPPMPPRVITRHRVRQDRREKERFRQIQEWTDQLRKNSADIDARLSDMRQKEVECARRRHEDQLAAERVNEQNRKNTELAEEEERQRKECANRMKECSVCGDLKDKDSFGKGTTTSKCTHDSMVCLDCLDSWIVSALNDNGLDGIKCPECPQKLAYSDIQAVAKQSTFEAYDKAATLQALSALPDFAWCLSAQCKSGQLNVDNYSNYMECASCHYKQCLKHKIAWHPGESCDQYDHRTSGAQAREEEAKTLAMLDTVSKLCPGPGCGWRIQKTEGCDHVTCRKCQFQFCWQCLASHLEIKRVGNTAHKKECKFHSTNLDLAWPFNRH